jgi:hypothetical protein
MSSGGNKLQVVYHWRRHPLGYRLLSAHQSVTFGTGRRAELIAPEGQLDAMGRAAWPRRMQLLRPARGGFRLRLWPSMSGRVISGGQTVDVGGLFATPAPPRFLRKPVVYRDIVLVNGDRADIVVDAVNQLLINISFVEPPEILPRPRRVDPLLLTTSFWSITATLSSLLAILWFGSRIAGPTMAISPERFAKVVAPMMEPEPSPAKLEAERLKREMAEQQRLKKEREAAESRKAKEKEGRLGREDADRKETVMPKGREDILRAKVVKTGILAVLGRDRAPGSGLGKLLNRTDSPEMEQALTGLSGAKLAVGRGSQGLGVAGTGLGGGGDSFGRIQGSGSLDVGAGRGRGRKGPNLGTGREKEVSVGLETGTPDAEGGLTREQVMRVVRAHAAAVKYCYEKELQRAPHLSGRIDISWIIHPNGTVDRVRVVKSAMGNAAVEGCIERQVRQWQFPKSDADTIVQSFPFLFKGGT